MKGLCGAAPLVGSGVVRAHRLRVPESMAGALRLQPAAERRSVIRPATRESRDVS